MKNKYFSNASAMILIGASLFMIPNLSIAQDSRNTDTNDYARGPQMRQTRPSHHAPPQTPRAESRPAPQYNAPSPPVSQPSPPPSPQAAPQRQYNPSPRYTGRSERREVTINRQPNSEQPREYRRSERYYSNQSTPNSPTENTRPPQYSSPNPTPNPMAQSPVTPPQRPNRNSQYSRNDENRNRDWINNNQNRNGEDRSRYSEHERNSESNRHREYERENSNSNSNWRNPSNNQTRHNSSGSRNHSNNWARKSYGSAYNWNYSPNSGWRSYNQPNYSGSYNYYNNNTRFDFRSHAGNHFMGPYGNWNRWNDSWGDANLWARRWGFDRYDPYRGWYRNNIWYSHPSQWSGWGGWFSFFLSSGIWGYSYDNYANTEYYDYYSNYGQECMRLNFQEYIQGQPAVISFIACQNDWGNWVEIPDTRQFEYWGY